jgi:hypothetical protein
LGTAGFPKNDVAIEGGVQGLEPNARTNVGDLVTIKVTVVEKRGVKKD